ncbi:MAG: hypothetical protein IJ644_02730 [Oscillospiraceae bacterium]|nr:hypothetical protein [Oscillospiraceae bacterium]
MTIPELYQNYYFHDSIFKKICLDKETGQRIVWCQFCNFLQENYENSQPTNSDIFIIFQNAQFSRYITECEVLTQELIDNRTIRFFLANEDNSDCFEFIISADFVEIEIIRTYNL